LACPFKKGLRCLGISESFRKNHPLSVLAGVVMRRDRIVDGVSITYITVGGLDATEGVIRLFRGLRRNDISFVMLNGCIISWYNIVDLERVYEEVGVPLICVTYEESSGLEDVIKKRFPKDCEVRLELYRKLGRRELIVLKTGYPVYVRYYGLEKWQVRELLNAFTLCGRQPEPLRVAALVARAVVRAMPTRALAGNPLLKS